MNQPAQESKDITTTNPLEVPADLICFSHLRWDFVYQRPQHLMSRCARTQRVFYVEEPKIDDGPSRLEVRQDESGVWVVIPYLRKLLDKLEARSVHKALIDQLIANHKVNRYINWYYTPMAIAYTDHLTPQFVVYDCMDDLSSFNGAHPKMAEYEGLLMAKADLVFTGGQSLYQAKRSTHDEVYPFPSSIDRTHFARARQVKDDPSDQAAIPHPRLGFFGVIDERMDLELVASLASAHPGWQLVLIGPFAKINEEKIPRLPNIHYLGMKSYEQLPSYLAGWDVAIMPFARNQSTRYISPTKTPEYLAGGKPVVSTPISDVARPYGELGLVSIAETPAEFTARIEAILQQSEGERQNWLARVDAYLAQFSWDETWESMQALITNNLRKKIGEISIGETLAIGKDTPNLAFTTPPAIKPAQRRNGHKKTYDYLIVGAGFAGSVLAERLAAGSNKKVLLIDCRPHIAGNAYDEYNEAGLLIHKYGPHIFHTNSKEVFAYLSRFTQWRSYEHRVRASVDGQLLPLPINLDTVNRLYGLNLSSFELDKFFQSVAEHRDPVKTSEDVVVNKVGRELYEKFFRNYTRKQWGYDPSELDSSVTARVPTRNNRDDRYFSDTYQSMPLHGFTRMFENMLDHPNIHIVLNTRYQELLNYVSYRELIFTGPVDEFFDYTYGKLPYRSLQFQFQTLDEQQHQPVAVVNYPNEHAYTRVTEFKHLTGQEHPKTTLVYEFPCNEGDPYYPIPRQENAELYLKYRQLAQSTPGVYFAGRLGTYKYYNMDQVTGQALTLYARLAGLSKSEAVAAYTPTRFSVSLPCTLLTSEETE